MPDRPVFLYAALYGEVADAEADYEAVFANKLIEKPLDADAGKSRR